MSDPLEQLAYVEEHLRQRRKWLSSMCYRECKPGKWLKPVGTHLFAYWEEKNEWSNWFVNGKDDNALWQAIEILPGDNFLAVLKGAEAWTKTSAGAYKEQHLELAPEWEYLLE